MAGNTGNTGNTKDRLEGTAHRAQETAGNLGHRAQEAATSVANRGQETAQGVAHRAQEMASGAAHRAEEAMSNVGSSMSSLAGQLRQNVPQGTLGSAAGAVADRLEAGGRYLQENDLREMADDKTQVMRRYPVASLCVGFGFGFLLGMAFTRR